MPEINSSDGASSRDAWLSAHIYFDGNIYQQPGDRVALELVRPFVERCQANGWTDRFFFIRYGDFGPHLRVRLRGSSDDLRQRVRPALVSHLLLACPGIIIDDVTDTNGVPRRPVSEAQPLAHRVRWIDYEREVDRYGGDAAIHVAEEVFRTSSQLAFQLIQHFDGDPSARLGKGLLAMLVQLYVYVGKAAAAAGLAKWYEENYLPRAAEQSGYEPESLTNAFRHGFDRQASRLCEYVEEAWNRLAAGDSIAPSLDWFGAELRRHRDALRSLQKNALVRTARGPVHSWEECWRFVVPSYMHMTNNRLGVSIPEESYLAHLLHRALTSVAVHD